MAFLTEARARSAAGSRHLAEQTLQKSATASKETAFDVFLSHSSLDAEVIAGVATLLEREGLRVYVDWLEDGQLSRAHVTAATAELLRTRMQASRSLIFASSENSPDSKWMPWELGYFDGIRPRRIAILPLLRTGQTSFKGQEYLSLYPVIEDVGLIGSRQRLGIFTSGATIRPMSMSDFIASGANI